MSEEENNEQNLPEEIASVQPSDDIESSDDPWGEALAEQAESETAEEIDQIAPSRAEFEDFDANSGGNGAGANDDINLDVILDVPITISMEIGRTKINIRNLLHLNQGSVVELDRLAGEPMDVLVNGTLIAHGEVVVVNDKFGIRLTDVISPLERVKKLQ